MICLARMRGCGDCLLTCKRSRQVSCTVASSSWVDLVPAHPGLQPCSAVGLISLCSAHSGCCGGMAGFHRPPSQHVAPHTTTGLEAPPTALDAPAQVYDADHLGGALEFKVRGLYDQSAQQGNVHYHEFKTWQMLFSNDTGMCDDYPTRSR